MVPGQHCPGEVVETPGARLAAIPLPMRSGVVAPVADYRIAAAAGTAHALWPAVLAHEGEALGIVHQAGKVDQVRCSHDGRSSSREPVGSSRSSHHSRCPPNALPRPTTPEHDKSHPRKCRTTSPTGYPEGVPTFRRTGRYGPRIR